MTTIHRPFDPMRRPPSPDGMGAGTTLAVLVHVGLIAALAYGVAWRRHDVTTVSAELWAAVPQIAAPMATEAPPPPPAPPAPKPAPAPPPPPPKAEPQPSRDADIALDKARKKAQAEREEAERQITEKKKADEKKARDKREAAEKADKAEKEEARRLADKKEADAKARADAAKDAKAEKAQAERLARLRQENLQRMSRDLGSNPAVGTATTPSAGTAAQSAAPSAGYEGRIRARILPNITYTGNQSSSIRAEVEVRVAPDGTIVDKRIIKPSGVAEWDQAVLKAIDKTEVLPRDIDGRVPSLMVLSFDPTKR